MFRNSRVGSNNKVVEWLLLFGILVLYNVATHANLIVKVWLDTAECDGNWRVRKEIVVRVLQTVNNLNLNGTGVYLRCQESQIAECYDNDHKAMETFLFFGNTSSSLVVELNRKLKGPIEVTGIPHNISQNFICGIATVDSTNPSDCTALHCLTSGGSEVWKPFNFSTSVTTAKENSTNNPNFDEKQSGKGLSPAAIAGASVGALAGFGLLATLAGLLHRKLSNAAKVGDSFSDVQPIVPGVSFGEAPNSVAPAGTS